MGYWKWLRKSIKAATWKRIKDMLRTPYAEFIFGFAAGFALFLCGLAYGASDNHLYYLLLLGLIPTTLILFHGLYRVKVKSRDQ